MADKTNTFIEIWSGDKLVDIILPEPSTTTAKSPTPLDRELVKVFQDRRNLLAACESAQLMLLQTSWNGDERMNIVTDAITLVKKGA